MNGRRIVEKLEKSEKLDDPIDNKVILEKLLALEKEKLDDNKVILGKLLVLEKSYEKLEKLEKKHFLIYKPNTNF